MNRETLLEKLDQVEKLIADIRTLCADVNPSEGEEVINPAQNSILPVGTRFLHKGLHLIVAHPLPPGACAGCALKGADYAVCGEAPSCRGKIFVEVES